MAIHLSCLKILESLKDCHGVDLGNGFLTDKAGVKIMKYISISQRIKNIMKGLRNQWTMLCQN